MKKTGSFFTALFVLLSLGLALGSCSLDTDKGGGGRQPEPILYTAQADGEADTVTSGKITFTFNAEVEGLSSADILLTPSARVTGGGLTGSGTTWVLLLTAVAEAGEAAVSITKDGIDHSVKTVTVYKAAAGMAVTGITGVPETAVPGRSLKPDLEAAAIEPETAAAGRTIVWSVKTAGTTGVTVENDFTPCAAGTMILTATVRGGKADGTDFMKDFTIAVNPAEQDSLDKLKDDIAGSGGTEIHPYAPGRERFKALLTTDEDLNTLLNYIKDGSGGGNVYVSLDLSDCPISILSGHGDNDYVVNLTLPALAVNIGDFNGWAKLKTLTIAAPELVSLSNSTFTASTVRGSVLETVDLSGCTGLKNLGTTDNDPNGIFKDCAALKSVALPDSVEVIGTRAFQGCPLGVINIPSALTTLGNFALYHTTEGEVTLTSVELPAGLTAIGSYNFFGYSNLTSAVILADDPPLLTSSSAAAVPFKRASDTVIIYVPAAYVEGYRVAIGWRHIADKIQAIPEEP